MSQSRLPRYKRPKHNPSPRLPLSAPTKPTPQQFSRRLYTVSWLAAMCWSGLAFVIGLCVILFNIKAHQTGDEIPNWVNAWLILFIIAWAYLTEAWWFGLFHRNFAEVSQKKVVFFGLFGHERKVFEREHYQFKYHIHKGIPHLYARRKGAWFWRPVSIVLCDNREALLEDLGAVSLLY